MPDRRTFLKSAAVGGMALTLGGRAMPAPPQRPKLKLGLDNFSIRALGWKAPRILEYAASLKVDVVLFSDLDVYESLDDDSLRDLRKKADDLGLALHAGTGSVCPSSNTFDPKHGTAEELLKLTIRVAKTLGSPVARCYLGNAKDREGEGGIQKHIRNVVQVFRNVRSFAVDAGVKIAIENHAGDTRSHESAALIEDAGKDFVGSTMDSGNATWALEDPAGNLEVLGPHAVCAGIRDSMIWETPEGAGIQWTAMGEGLVDWKAYFARWSELCPGTPVILEIITGFSRSFPYKSEAFWKAWPAGRDAAFGRWLALARHGKPMEPFRPPAGSDPRTAEQEFQKAELERSIRYCREVLGLGGKT